MHDQFSNDGSIASCSAAIRLRRRITALLPVQACRRLTSTLWNGDDVVIVPHAGAATEQLDRGGAFVFDPRMASEKALGDLVRHAITCGLPVIALSSPDLDSVRALLRIGWQFRIEIVLWGAHDEAVRIARALGPSASLSVRCLVLYEVVEQLLRLPHHLLLQVAGVLGRGDIPPSTAEFIASQDRSRRTAERQLMDAGLAAPSTIVRVARVVRGCDALFDGTWKVSDVVRQIQYSSMRTLQADAHAILGMSLRTCAKTLDRKAAADRIASVLRRDREC